ncbi:MAG: 16S rRNA (guanine(527)-N(7))-methyltransferase RsmG [Leptolyngbyaceae cyanobacterium bins.59]|nr:16S rRNA (guanine(527)-N(7))-methyltransferase RsmG [Leptolyngbyaceae cyanobacterium bins.59]
MSSSFSLPDLTPSWQETLGWQPTPEQQQQFQTLYDLILEGNQRLNLTRILEPTDFWEKHLWDSLRGIKPFLATSHSASWKAIDIGTGAGFPGVPIALVRPEWSITLLDGTRKKIDFLRTLTEKLGLTNVQALHGRAEQVNQNKPQQNAYDLALLRAVGPVTECAQYALPFLKKNGVAVLYRGQWTAEETETLETALDRLGGALESVDAFTTPLSHSIRHCLHIKKSRGQA